MEYDKELGQCLERELWTYLVTEEGDLTDISLEEIKNKDLDKIAYFKGAYDNNNSDMKYIIVYPKDALYEYEVMRDFERYFYEKFAVYQSESINEFTIYIHSKDNDVDFNSIVNKCQKKSVREGKAILDDTIDNLRGTTKIVVKSKKEEFGKINDIKKIEELISVVKDSIQYGNNCFADGHSLELEMYDINNKLLDVIYVWRDGKRLIPKSSGGCYYYAESSIDLREIIESETDYVFYSILDFREDEEQEEQLIYEDLMGKYYLKARNSNEILIRFKITGQVMALKYALEKGYIKAQKVAREYPVVLVKK